MSTRSVQMELLGETVTGEVVDTRMVADYGDGLRDEVTVDVGGAHYCFDADDVDEWLQNHRDALEFEADSDAPDAWVFQRYLNYVDSLEASS